jgi:DNA replication protein DnaC
MNKEPTMHIKELTDDLKLHAFYETLQEQLQQHAYDDIPFEKRIQLLLEAEKTSRDNKKIIRLQRQAKLHEKSAVMEEIRFAPTRGIHKATLLELAGGGYIRSYRNIILTGATGTGKSYIAQALANKAMVQGYSALYLRIPRLMQLLSSARGDDEYLKLLARLKKVKVLILDDFGVSPLKASEARDLLEIAEDRTNCSSLIITSQLPIKEWHGHLHNPTIADAILDRIIHNAYKINLEGESQRKLKNQK